jgi:hypothetical protein
MYMLGRYWFIDVISDLSGMQIMLNITLFISRIVCCATVGPEYRSLCTDKVLAGRGMCDTLRAEGIAR